MSVNGKMDYKMDKEKLESKSFLVVYIRNRILLMGYQLKSERLR